MADQKLTQLPSLPSPITTGDALYVVRNNTDYQAASSDLPAGSVTNVTGTAPISSSGGATPVISLNDTAVTPGSYGSATKSSTLTVDQKGRLTAAGETTVTPAVGSITGLGTGVVTAIGNTLNEASGLVGNLTPTNGYVITGNGTAWTTAAGSGDAVISPTTLTADQNDWNPTGLSTATIIRLSGDSSLRSITSILAQTDRKLTLINVGSNTVLLRDQNAQLGTAANRLALGGVPVVPLWPGCSISIYYSSASSRWEMIASSSPIVPTLRRGQHVATNCSQFVEIPNATSPYITGFSFSKNTSGTGADIQNSFPDDTYYLTFATDVFWLLNTGTTTTGSVFFAGTNWASKIFLTSAKNYWLLEFNVEIPVASNNTDNFTATIGFFDAIPSPGSGVFFRYNHAANSGNFQGIITDGVETVVNLNVGPNFQFNVGDILSIVILPTRVEWYVNRTLAGSTTTLTHLPTTNNNPFDVGAGINKTAGTTARVMAVYSVELTSGFPTP